MSIFRRYSVSFQISSVRIDNLLRRDDQKPKLLWAVLLPNAASGYFIVHIVEKLQMHYGNYLMHRRINLHSI